MLKILGLDIGTTTISAVVADAETGKILESRTVKNNSVIDGTKLQNPQVIIDTVLKIKHIAIFGYLIFICIERFNYFIRKKLIPNT